jgi:hypothetical protein
MSQNQVLLNKIQQILTERQQLFQGKVITSQPLQVILDTSNQIVSCIALNSVNKGQSVIVFKDLDAKQYYCFTSDVSVSSNNGSVVYYDNFNRRRTRELPSKNNIFYFLLDVSNSIEMAAIDKCLQILNGDIATPLKIKRNDLVGLISFADGIYTYSKYINKPVKKSKAIEILNNLKNGYDNLATKLDRYNPASFVYADFNIANDDADKVEKLEAYSRFWVDEGTDLPENGIDAIHKSIEILTVAIADKKYIYLVTDNNRYSRNETPIETVNNKLQRNKLFIQTVEPINRECLRIGYTIEYEDREEIWLQTQIGEEISNLKIAEYEWGENNYSGLFDLNVTNYGSGENDYVISYQYSYDSVKNTKRFTHPNSTLDDYFANDNNRFSEGITNVHVWEGSTEYTHTLNRMGYWTALVGNGYVIRDFSMLFRVVDPYSIESEVFTDNTFTELGTNQFVYNLFNSVNVGDEFIYHLPKGLDIPMNEINNFIDVFPEFTTQFNSLNNDIENIEFEDILGLPNILTNTNFIDLINNKPNAINPFLYSFNEYEGIRDGTSTIRGEKFNNNDINSPYKTIIKYFRNNLQYSWNSSVNPIVDVSSDKFLNSYIYNFSVNYSTTDGSTISTPNSFRFRLWDYRNNQFNNYFINKDIYNDNPIDINYVAVEMVNSNRGDNIASARIPAHRNLDEKRIEYKTLSGITQLPFNHTRDINIDYKRIYSLEIFDPQFNDRYSTISPEYIMKEKRRKIGTDYFPLIVGNKSFVECEVNWDSTSDVYGEPVFSFSNTQSYSGFVANTNTLPVARNIDEMIFTNDFYYCTDEGKRYFIEYYDEDLNENNPGYRHWEEFIPFGNNNKVNNKSVNLAKLIINNNFTTLNRDTLIKVDNTNIDNLKTENKIVPINFYDFNLLPTQEKCRLQKSPIRIDYTAKKLELPEGVNPNDVNIYSISYYIPQELKEILELSFSTHSVIRGEETNPYCGEETTAQLLLNDNAIGKYPNFIAFTRTLRNYLLWRETGKTYPYFGSFSDTESLTTEINLHQTIIKWDSKYKASFGTYPAFTGDNGLLLWKFNELDPLGGWHSLETVVLSPQIDIYNSLTVNYNVLVNGGYSHSASKEIIIPLDYVELVSTGSASDEIKYSPYSVARNSTFPINNGFASFRVKTEYLGQFYYEPLHTYSWVDTSVSSVQTNITSVTQSLKKYLTFKNNNKVYFSLLLDEDSISVENIYRLQVKRGVTTILTQYIHTNSVETLNGQKEVLRTGNSINREIELGDSITVKCEPIIESNIINIPSELYSNSLPPSTKIIYL